MNKITWILSMDESRKQESNALDLCRKLDGLCCNFEWPIHPFCSVVFFNEIVPGVQLGAYLGMSITALLVLYVFFHSVYRVFLRVLKQAILSVLSLIVIVFGGYYITGSSNFLQGWFNPWSLFYWQGLLMDRSSISLWLNIVFVLLLSQFVYWIYGKDWEKRIFM